MNAESTSEEREVIRKHSKSFALAARLLSPVARRRAERLYAWCRYADDLIDHAPTPSASSAALKELQADLAAITAGQRPTAPAAQLLAQVMTECYIPQRYPEELLAGMAMDANNRRYQTLDELLVYCHRVAGTVGLMMCHTLGVSDDQAGPHAGCLGIAMQLTNIARDVAEDAKRNRIYLPLEWFDHEPQLDQLPDQPYAIAIRRLLTAADEYYAVGSEGLKFLDRRSRLAVDVAHKVYREIGLRVRASGCRPSAGRAIVPTWRKIRTVATVTLQACVSSTTTSSRPPRTLWHYQPQTGYFAEKP